MFVLLCVFVIWRGQGGVGHDEEWLLFFRDVIVDFQKKFFNNSAFAKINPREIFS